MPTWGEILKELQKEVRNGNKKPHDTVRRKYLIQLHKETGRNTILYAADWTSGKPVPAGMNMILPSDIQGFMEVIHGLDGNGVDIILHSSGGSAEAVESVVNYIRTKFTDVRVFIPHAAMSAATMMACSAEQIIMGKHSFIGPIDPQMTLRMTDRIQICPAHAIIEQFDWIRQQCRNPVNLAAFIPILTQYGPALLKQCEHAIDLSIELVSHWLETYMFKNEKNAKHKAMRIAKELADHERFKSHGRFISRHQAEELGLKIDYLERNNVIQDLVLSVFHSTTHTFSGTGATKIIENHLGKAYVNQMQLAFQPPLPPMQIPQPRKLPR